MRTVTIDSPNWTIIEDLDFRGLTLLERTALEGLLTLEAGPLAGSTRVRRRMEHIVGFARVRGVSIEVVPPFPAQSLVTLIGYSESLDFRKFASYLPSSAIFGAQLFAAQFERLVAAMLARYAEDLLRGFVSRHYETVRHRLEVIRGRPTWVGDFGHHPIEGISCRFATLTTDDVLNRLVLAGLLRARRVLRGSSMEQAASTQAFIWTSLASSVSPRPVDFDVGFRSLDRLREPYRPALVLAHALLFGTGPTALGLGKGALQGMYFDLARLFERAMSRLLRECARSLGLDVIIQREDRRAL
ncbi:MAG TPA: hypothetical protein VGR71_11125, partial [Nitrospira sp.]|nr:hypothetical protein [Nitrospira sp.]